MNKGLDEEDYIRKH